MILPSHSSPPWPSLGSEANAFNSSVLSYLPASCMSHTITRFNLIQWLNQYTKIYRAWKEGKRTRREGIRTIVLWWKLIWTKREKKRYNENCFVVLSYRITCKKIIFLRIKIYTLQVESIKTIFTINTYVIIMSIMLYHSSLVNMLKASIAVCVPHPSTYRPS